ncbi:MAG: FAD-binding protein [Phycisphaerae bacterium]|nr:FAD-binding protein [Phycisphaerae bacterium]
MRVPVIEGPAATGVMGDQLRRALARDLANAVRGEVRFDAHNRMLYATDASLYQVEPVGVVIPADVDDAAEAARFCLARGVPILPRGGGTSLAGQCTGSAVVLDLSPNCRRLLEVGEGWCRVEPGITVDDLNDELARTGLFFAPDPATSRHATVGGCIGNNAAGGRSIVYGRTSESLIGVDACLGDGSRVMLERGAAGRDPRVGALGEGVARVVREHAGLIDRRFPRTIRRNAGYNLDLMLAQARAPFERGPLDNLNLAHLVCGSEGTLALTLGATLRLHPRPRARGLAVIGFGSLDDAIGMVGPILGTGPSAVELLDDMIIGLARANAEYRRYVDLLPASAGRTPAAVLYVEYSEVAGGLPLAEGFAALRGAAGSAPVREYTGAEAMLAAWKLRKAGEPLLHGVPGDRKPVTFVEDNAVPVERLGEFVRRFRAIVERHGTRASFWAHASVGVLHVRPLLNLRDEDDRRRMREIAVEVADLARELGGVMSGEHGDGRVRGPLLERFYGPELMDAFRRIKALFDPHNLFNPGNIVRPGPIGSITERVRVRPDPARPAVDAPGVDTAFDFGDQHGLRGAAEMCNGAGVCRKKSGGTMCPSYMATLDERHSARGRGNALRLAITGQFTGPGAPGSGPNARGSRDPSAPAPWNDAETLATLDLCLSCKACKSECPSNVDIARLKAEYLAQGHRSRGRPTLEAVLFSRVRGVARAGSWAPGLVNAINRFGPVRALMERLTGIDRRRSLPLAATPLPVLLGREGLPGGPAGSPEVAIFGDCFTTYSEPSIGVATARVLRALGYGVRLVDAGCCQRPAISMGVLDGAVEEAGRTLERLESVVADAGVRAIVVCEPSCLSALKDDWLSLRIGASIGTRRALADKAFLPEEFIERFAGEHPRAVESIVDRDRVPGRIVLHGHCHQKALWGVESSAALLRRLVGEGLTVLDSGCCGMAGSFGLLKRRFDLSMKIGGLGLFPAIRAARDAAVAAPGASCRHQVLDGTGVRARHPIEILAAALAD